MTVTIDSLKTARKQARDTGKPVKLLVGQGIRVNVSKFSSTFQLRYRMKEEGKLKEKTLTLDPIVARTDPNLSKAITKAIDDADKAKSLIQQGIDPSTLKKINKAKNTASQKLTPDNFFYDWLLGVSKAAQWSDKYYKNTKTKYTKYISPEIGSLPFEMVTREDIAGLLEKLANTPATYKKVRSLINMLFEDVTTLGKIKFNPTPKNKIKAVQKHVEKKLPAITRLPLLQNMLVAIDKLKLSPEVKEAAILQAHTALRSQTVVEAKWSEFDLTKKLWSIPRIKGRIKLHDADKYGNYYTVPLSDELVTRLTNWRNSLRWQKSDFLFSSNSKRGYISIDSVRKVYKDRLEIDTHCAHGWRSSFSTIAHEAVDKKGRALFRADVIERCLDHVVGNAVTQAYNRGELLDLRKHLMSWWSKQLCSSNVAEIRQVKKG